MKSALSALVAVAVAAPAFGQELVGDPTRGAKVFRKCKACHAVGPSAVSKIGPTLNGIIGRRAASINGFKYSAASKKASENGLVWTPEELNEYLLKPRQHMPGTAMNFVGLRKGADRANVIAYLRSFGADGDKVE